MAPEFYDEGLYSKKTDVWGFCATIAYCFTGMEENGEYEGYVYAGSHMDNLKEFRETRLSTILLSVLSYQYQKSDEEYKRRLSIEELDSIWPREVKEFKAILRE
jgi:hypothetical protein